MDDLSQEVIDNLFAARQNASATLAQILLTPKMSYNVHGHSYRHNEYQTMLREQIAGINKLLSEMLPFEAVSAGM